MNVIPVHSEHRMLIICKRFRPKQIQDGLLEFSSYDNGCEATQLGHRKSVELCTAAKKFGSECADHHFHMSQLRSPVTVSNYRSRSQPDCSSTNIEHHWICDGPSEIVEWAPSPLQPFLVHPFVCDDSIVKCISLFLLCWFCSLLLLPISVFLWTVYTFIQILL